MGKSPKRIAALIAVGLIGAVGVAAAPAAGALTDRALTDRAQTEFTVIANHLNNPRGLSPAPGGGFYLAEAGSGGSHCVKGGEEGTTCVGLTGSLDEVDPNGEVERIVGGLISASGPGGSAAEGPVSVSTAPNGAFMALFGLSTQQVPPKGVIPAALRNAALAQLGHLWRVRENGRILASANVGSQDWIWSSQHKSLAPKDFPDANPNNVLYTGGDIYVVDAGTNVLDRMGTGGVARVLNFFPVPKGWQSDSVPTCVAQGPDHAFYVAERLGGFYAPGHARVWRFVPGHGAKVWATGLTTVQGCGFGSNGAFYATEFQVHGLTSSNPAGDVVRIWHGVRTHLGVGRLFDPSGFAAGRNGSIYVSNCSIAPATGLGPHLCPKGGQIVRLG
jgi:hypothetical protein